MTTTQYTPDYYISKFEAIPDKFWTTGNYATRRGDTLVCCAYGHCGVRGIFDEQDGNNEEADALRDLFLRCPLKPASVIEINDGRNPNFQQPTPKARILAALREIKAVTQNSK
jgi:hypothetical protein